MSDTAVRPATDKTYGGTDTSRPPLWKALRALGVGPRHRPDRRHLVRQLGVARLPEHDHDLLRRPQHRRDRDHGVAVAAHRDDRRDRPVGRGDARPVRRGDGQPLPERHVDLAGHGRRAGRRRGRRGAQRVPRGQGGPAVDRGHHRHAHAVPRHRRDRAAQPDQQAVPGRTEQGGHRSPAGHADRLFRRHLHRAGHRLRGRTARHARSDDPCTRSACSPRRPSSPASACSGSASGCSCCRA